MTPQQATLYDAVAKLIKAKGRFHTEQNYAALVTAFDAETAARRAPAPTEPAVDRDAAFDFHAHLARQAAWSEKTFGPGPRTKGVCDHIRKELIEVEADPLDLKEWVDVVILALDGAWRCGGKPDEIIAGIVAKQTKNEGRVWPDWRTADPDKAIEHDRSHDVATPASPAVPEPAPKYEYDDAQGTVTLTSWDKRPQVAQASQPTSAEGGQ